MSGIEQTRENLMEAFWSCYKEKPIGKITVMEICKKAGYNSSTFYEYFKSVYEVLEAVEEAVITREDFKVMVVDNLLFANEREHFIHAFARLFEERGEYLSILLGENGDPSFRKKLLERIAPIIDDISDNLSQEDLRHIHYLMEYQTSGVLNLLNLWFSQGRPIPIEEIVKIIIEITTNGIQSEMQHMLQIRIHKTQ